MIGTSERRSAEFFEWESRGRGHRVWPYPVSPEPPFVAFLPSRERAPIDDGRKPTFISSAIRRLSARLSPDSKDLPSEADEDNVPDEFERGELVEYAAHIPAGLRFDPSAYATLFTSLSAARAPISFEFVATAERIVTQFVVDRSDAVLAAAQFRAFLPEVEFSRASEHLSGTWDALDGSPTAVVEFGLGREFMLPLGHPRSDPFIGLVGALSEIGPEELGVFQVTYSPLSPRWRESILRSVTHADGSALFVNAPELLPGAKEKTASPLFAAVVRIAVRAPDDDRAWQIAVNTAAALSAYGSPAGNELVPLGNDGYSKEAHSADVPLRQCRRSGMVVNAEELAGFVHIPSAEVKSLRLRAEGEKSKAAPGAVRNPAGLRLGVNIHAGVSTPVVLSEEARVRHMHVVGASGTGKSTLLANLIRQDLEAGLGCSVLDPHGDLIDRVLALVPERRKDDVVLLDPSDEEYAVGFNVLAAHSEWEKALLASDLVAVFRRLSTSWGDQLNSVLSNALLAFMESDKGGTLFDVRRFLLEPKFRAEFLKSVRDSNVAYYWHRAFPMLTGNRSVGPVVTRLDTFLSAKPIRYMVAQKENRLDFRDILDGGKIFLAKLPEGVIGRENSHLLGSLLVSKIQAAAMSRQRDSAASRRYHTLFADEFYSFLTPSLAECLSGVRKYRLGLVLAHQEMRQVERDWDLASALLNAGTRIAFRVNERDARLLEGGYSNFEARDLQNLSIGHAIGRIERSDCDFNLAVDALPHENEREAGARRERIVDASRRRYGTPRAEVERLFFIEADTNESEAKEKATRPQPPKPQPSPEPESTAQAPVPPKSVSEQPPLAIEPAAPSVRAPDVLPSALAVPKPKPDVPTADLGRGGAQHKAVQDRLKEEAEKLGFRVSVEKRFEGLGQIDLVFLRGEVSIACEVTVENTVDYEVGNVAKCFKAGFNRIAVVGVSEEKLGKLQAAVTNSLGLEKAACVAFYLPDAFIGALRGTPKSAPNPKATAEPARTRGGRVVKRKIVTLSAEQMKEKEDEALRVMARLMKQKPNPQ